MEQDGEKPIFYLGQSIKAKRGGTGIDRINEFSLHHSLGSSARTRTSCVPGNCGWRNDKVSDLVKMYFCLNLGMAVHLGR